jgi:tellurite resistance protein TerA
MSKIRRAQLTFTVDLTTMENLSRGQRVALAKLDLVGKLQVSLSAQGVTLDFASFGLDAAGKLSDERYMTFFNQPQTPCRAVELVPGASNSVGFRFALDLLPVSIERIVITACIDGGAVMSQVETGFLRLMDGSREAARFVFAGTDFAAEKAVMLGEFYRKDGQWRFMAVAQGFNGGMDALVRHFGGVVEEAPVVQAEPKKVSLSKVSLTKAGQTHKLSLEKGAQAPRKIVVKATWVDNGDNSDDNDDLDLRVGILLPNGQMKFIQAPEMSGNFSAAPYVFHLGDVMKASEKEPATETVEVNPEIAKFYGGEVALVCSVYSAVANGAVSVASLRPKMVMEYGQQMVECDFDFRGSKAAKDETVYTYVIGIIRITADSVTLEPSGATSEPGSENTPWLRWNGQKLELAVVGPVVFKGANRGKEAEFNVGNPLRYSL